LKKERLIFCGYYVWKRFIVNENCLKTVINKKERGCAEKWYQRFLMVF